MSTTWTYLVQEYQQTMPDPGASWQLVASVDRTAYYDTHGVTQAAFEREAAPAQMLGASFPGTQVKIEFNYFLVQNDLDALGSQGWELVSISSEAGPCTTKLAVYKQSAP